MHSLNSQHPHLKNYLAAIAGVGISDSNFEAPDRLADLTRTYRNLKYAFAQRSAPISYSNAPVADIQELNFFFENAFSNLTAASIIQPLTHLQVTQALIYKLDINRLNIERSMAALNITLENIDGLMVDLFYLINPQHQRDEYKNLFLELLQQMQQQQMPAPEIANFLENNNLFSVFKNIANLYKKINGDLPALAEQIINAEVVVNAESHCSYPLQSNAASDFEGFTGIESNLTSSQGVSGSEGFTEYPEGSEAVSFLSTGQN